MSVKLEDQVKSIAKDLGFEDCRFARAQKASHAEEFQDWLDDHKHGDMAVSYTHLTLPTKRIV